MPTYYPIDEAAARRAKEMNSFSDYKPGSATESSRRSVDEAAAIAEAQKAQVDPMYHEKIDRLLDVYARKLAENINKSHARDFLRHVLEVYQDEQDTSIPVGSNGAAIGSSDYLQRIERDVFHSDLSMMYSARFGSPDYTALLRDSLDEISNTLLQDLLIKRHLY